MRTIFLSWLAVLFILFILGVFFFDGHGTTDSIFYLPWLILFFGGIIVFVTMIFKGMHKK